MDLPDVFTIVFDDPNRVYQPGQCVSGRVELHLSNPTKMDGVFLTVFGGAITHWTESELQTFPKEHPHHTLGEQNLQTVEIGQNLQGNNNTTARIETESRYVKVHYASSEVYVNVPVVMLWGNGCTTFMPAGQYSFPFAVNLPQVGLPSFQGSMGRILYYCKVKIDRPWHFDITVKEMFTVLPVYDLNLNPSAGVGVNVEDSKSLGCCCWDDGTVYLQMSIPKSGYVPGECIKAKIDIDNRSSRQMESVEFQLLQIVNYTAEKQVSGFETGTPLMPTMGMASRHMHHMPQFNTVGDEWLDSGGPLKTSLEAPSGPWGPNRSSGHAMFGHTRKKCERRTLCKAAEPLESMQVPSKYAISKDLRVPPVVATMGTSAIIQVEYVLECKLISSGLSMNRENRLPIIIGTVPLRLLTSAPPMDQPQNIPLDQPQNLPLDQPQNPPLDRPRNPPLVQPQNLPLDQPQHPPQNQTQNLPLDQLERPTLDQPQNPPQDRPRNPPLVQPQNPPLEQTQNPPLDQLQHLPLDQPRNPPLDMSVIQPAPPLPSYEECMFGKMDVRDRHDNENTRGDFDFAPRYPVYNL